MLLYFNLAFNLYKRDQSLTVRNSVKMNFLLPNSFMKLAGTKNGVL